MQGRELFAGFLEKNGISPAEAGRRLGVTRVAVYRWLDDGRPGQPLRIAIDNWTRGEVPAASWVTDRELDRCAVAPFDATDAIDIQAADDHRASDPEERMWIDLGEAGA